MAFGFGFNKAKVLNSAEKHVQQGKIQNAINDYEKVLQHEPRDLAILNTLGDLYARVGDPDRAASYFKKVGEAYAADGFTVKAIALYKKITKINPSGVEDIKRLAELYTQQNLLSDARQQYLLVADQYTKSNRLDAAIGIFQKMLEFDPENVAMQTRLAEIYVRVGKKEEAQEIFFQSAELLQKRGSAEGADEALTRVLTLSPGNPRALLMRAQIAVESGHHAAAIRYLESVASIDSNPAGLACLLRARLAMAQPEEAEPLARKLLVVHDDLSGINHYADWLLSRGQFEAALRIYAEHSDRLLASDPARLLNALRGVTDRVKENATALELVLALLQKAGEQSQITEVIELLAHALVQRGDLVRARDFYRDLSVLEPENPVHEQNYRQMVARLGQDSVVRSLTPQEGGRAFMAEELESSAPVLKQTLDENVNSAVEAALTEAELLDSYNLHPKAIATLQAVLSQAPRDVRLHQRLATAYARSEQYQDAARSCDLLTEVFQESGHATQAREYAALAEKYRQQAAPGEPAGTLRGAVQEDLQPAQPEQAAEGQVEVEAISAAGADETVTASTEAMDLQSPFAASQPGSQQSDPEFPVEFEPQPEPVQQEAAEQAEGTAGANPAEIELDISDEWQPVIQPAGEARSQEPEPESSSEDEVIVEPDEPANSPAAELLEEIRFYIGQQMWEEAATVMETRAGLAAQIPELPELQQQIEAALAAAASSNREMQNGTPEPAVAEVEIPEFRAAGIPLHEAPPAPAAQEYGPEQAAALQNTWPAAINAAQALPNSPFPDAGLGAGNMLDNLIAGLQDAIPSDLVSHGPQLAGEAPRPAPEQYSVPVPNDVDYGAAGQPQMEELDLPDSVPARKNALSELFDEFKQEAEQPGSDEDDPESHYNLGIAFREMGLLDEAIGELQKVARTIDTRRSFRDSLQVYTLLGQCFLEKGVPEAAVPWYEKALSSASDGEARVAVHYELGSAHEAAGSRPAALKHFMEVYGANIDYRDVAERIRVLKS